MFSVYLLQTNNEFIVIWLPFRIRVRTCILGILQMIRAINWNSWDFKIKLNISTGAGGYETAQLRRSCWHIIIGFVGQGRLHIYFIYAISAEFFWYKRSKSINTATVIRISALLLWICLDTATNSQHLNSYTLHAGAMDRTASTHSIHIHLTPLSFIQTACSSNLSVVMHIVTCSHGLCTKKTDRLRKNIQTCNLPSPASCFKNFFQLPISAKKRADLSMLVAVCSTASNSARSLLFMVSRNLTHMTHELGLYSIPLAIHPMAYIDLKIYIYIIYIWVFPLKMDGLLLKWMIWGYRVPLFSETSIYIIRNIW